METIGLIAAMPQESAAFLRYVTAWERIKVGALRGAHFQLGGRDCYLLTSGIGLQRARDGARALLASASPHLLVSFGIAGAAREDLNIGDVVVPSHVHQLEMGQLSPMGTLASLSPPARDAATQALQPDGARLVMGTAITTRGSQVTSEQLGNMAHPILEMETAGITPIATEMGIPLLSIRSISDGPQAPLPFDLEVIFDEKEHLRIGKMLLLTLRRPQVLLQSWQMVRNSQKAADHAARALFAVLRQPSPII